MPLEGLVVVILTLVVFGFFVVVVAYADFTENRLSRGMAVRSARRRSDWL